MTDYNHDATLNSALTALQSGDRAAAVKLCRLATQTRADDAEGWSVLGLALGNEEGLEALQRAVDMEPREPRWQLHLGMGMRDAGKLQASQSAYARAAELSKGHPSAMTAWAGSLMALERFMDAAQVYRQVLQAQPSPEIWIKAGDALTGARDTINAARAYESAYPPENRPLDMNARLADIHIALNHYDRAEEFNQAVFSADPNNAAAGLRAANLKRWRGDHAGALKIQQEFWAKNPGDTGLVAALLDDRDDSVLAEAINIADTVTDDVTGRRRVCFALARHFDRAEDEGKAWHYAVLANSLYNDGAAYDNGGQHRAQLSKALDVFAAMPDLPVNDTGMIYVMGPPRCGGSLLQTILCQAGGLVSVGERGALLSWLIPGLDDVDDLMLKVPHLGAADIAGMTHASGQARVFVDKTSPHIIVAGLLAKIHPGAKFVLPRRNHADMIVSMFFHDFSPEFAYTRSVGGIAAYLKFQDEAAQAWRNAGIDIISHDHDAFTQAPETIGERLFKALDLPWSPEYLDTESSGTVVRTFSSRQVRGGVSGKFAGRGARYAAFLGEAGFTPE